LLNFKQKALAKSKPLQLGKPPVLMKASSFGETACFTSIVYTHRNGQTHQDQPFTCSCAHGLVQLMYMLVVSTAECACSENNLCIQATTMEMITDHYVSALSYGRTT